LTVTGGSKLTRIEIIEVGDAKYKRVDNGIWSKWIRTETKEYTLRGEPSMYGPKEVVIYTSSEARLNGRSVRLVSSVSNLAWGIAPGSHIKRLWIGVNGLATKSVEIVSEGNPGYIVQKTVVIYEYDPRRLRIEAPIK
jgi:hypothetical protein